MSATPAERIWTPVELIRWTAGYLTGKGFDEARLTAELLLADTLRLKRLDLYLQFERPLTPEELAEFKGRLRRRTRREPLQYISGTASFRNLELRVDERVLIPRPETEVLVDLVLAWAEGRAGLDVVDVGTGSGAIALSLRQEGAFARIVATDLSWEALEVARANAAVALDNADVEFRQGDGLGAVAGERFDVIVSNPPYIGEADRGSLEPEVVDWEPAAALFGGADGLAVIRTLIAEAPEHLSPGGLLAVEIGTGQSPAVVELIRQNRSYAEPSIHADLTGRERIVLVELASSPPAT